MMPIASKDSYYPRRLILAASLFGGFLLSLAVHLILQNVGFDVGGLWRIESAAGPRASSAVAWWLIAAAGFGGGYWITHLMARAVSGHLSKPMRYLLMVISVVLLAAAGQIAAAPSKLPTLAGIFASLAVIGLGLITSFCGAHFALRRA